MLDQINDLLSLLDKIQGLPAAGLVVLSCIAVGYGLRFWKNFPNRAIPVVVILWGALAMLSLADPRPTTMLRRLWWARNFSVGLVLGMVAWFAHYLILWRFDRWVRSKFPGDAPADDPAVDPDKQQQQKDTNTNETKP